MTTPSQTTENVVRSHLQAFVQQRGIPAILADYADDARLYADAAVYRGKKEIGKFFVDFIGGLPPRGIEMFALRNLRVDGPLAYITWTVGSAIPLGTDTFVVENGRIVSQTVAMYAPASSDAGGEA